MRRAISALLTALCALAAIESAHAQGNTCRTSPVGASTYYCASEAFVTQSRGTLTPATFSTLPACASGTEGQTADVTDSTTSLFGATITGGGSAHVLAYCNGTNWSVAGGGTLGSGGVIFPASGNFPITSSYCSGTVNWSGNPGTITLGAAGGFPVGCVIQVCNSNSVTISFGAATQSGFPAGMLPHLWMGQCETVSIASGAWVASVVPGRFKPPFNVTCYADEAGGNNGNDGLVSVASGHAVQDPQQCWLTWAAELDLSSQQPTIMLHGSQTFPQSHGAGCLSLSLGANGGRVVFVEVDSGAVMLQCTVANVVATQNDFGGYWIFGFTGGALTLDCTNAASHPCYDIFNHQQGGFDIFGTNVTLQGATTADYGVFSDSMMKGNMDGTPNFSGSFFFLTAVNLGSMLVFNNGASIATGTGIHASGGMFQTSQNSTLQWSGTMAFGTGTSDGADVFLTTNGSNTLLSSSFAVTGSIGGSPRQYTSLGNSNVCNSSATAIPGGAGRTSVAGAINGFAVASGGVCLP